METFSAAIQEIGIKKIMRNRLQLAAQSLKLGRGIINIFTHIPPLNSLLPFKQALDFAAGRAECFEYWFQCLLQRACIDLLDARGNLTEDLLLIFRQNDSGIDLVESLGMPVLTRSLLQAYCQHFIGSDIENQAQNTLLQRWSQKMALLTCEDFSVTAYLAEVSEVEWQRLCFLWRWVQYCARHCVEDPLKFCVAIEYFYYAVLHYLSLNDDIPFDDEKMAMISEKLVAEVGLISLPKKQADIIAGLYNTFYRCVKKQPLDLDDSSSVARELTTLLQKHTYLQQVCAYQSCIIAQFFMLGVIINQHDDSGINMSFLIHTSDFQPTVVQYLEQQTTHYFYHRFAVDAEKNRVREIKKSLDDFKSDAPMALVDRIQACIRVRQLLVSWLTAFPYDISYCGIRLLFEIDEQVVEYAEIVKRMEWIKSFNHTAPLDTSACKKETKQKDLLSGPIS